MSVLVVDASVVAAALVDDGPVGRWAEQRLRDSELAAPPLLWAEVASVLRRAADSGLVSSDVAALAHADLVDLRVEMFDYRSLADRIWQLRDYVTPYDAWYVALAELVDARLATLDERLARAPGPTCRFELPLGG